VPNEIEEYKDTHVLKRGQKLLPECLKHYKGCNLTADMSSLLLFIKLYSEQKKREGLDTKIYTSIQLFKVENRVELPNLKFKYTYAYEDDGFYGPEDPNDEHTLNLLTVECNCRSHALLVTDPEKLTKCKSCHLCHNFFIDVSVKENQYKFDEHVKKCTGDIKEAQVRLDESKPFAPHIQKNETYAHFLARSMINQWKPNQYFICWDLETLEKKIEQET
jgi:hypothetical protein